MGPRPPEGYRPPPTLICTPPHYRRPHPFDPRASVFLGGSIEMGSAADWQSLVISALNGPASVLYNPRRADWDSTWAQTPDNPDFTAQVHWEMDRINDASFVLLHFEPDTKSPITLGELYWCLARKPQHTIVSCPDGFWRRGNVQIMCERENVLCHDSLDEAVADLMRRLLDYACEDF